MEFVIVTLSKDDVCRILYQESRGALESAIGKRDIQGRLLRNPDNSSRQRRPHHGQIRNVDIVKMAEVISASGSGALISRPGLVFRQESCALKWAISAITNRSVEAFGKHALCLVRDIGFITRKKALPSFCFCSVATNRLRRDHIRKARRLCKEYLEVTQHGTTH